MQYLKLVLFGLANTVLCLIFYFLYKKTKFGKIKNIYRQIIVGVVFGGLAILCTEFGSKINNSVLNVRDAAPITAALVFGWPAGIIAGAIGGIERFFSTYWNGTYFTQIGCTISTIISGVVAGLLNKFVFKEHRPKWYQALAIGLVLETAHILMIFITNLNDVTTAYQYVEAMGNIMITAVGFSVMIAVLTINIIGRKDVPKINLRFHKPHIATLLNGLLFAVVVTAYVNVAIFSRHTQSRISIESANQQIANNVDDVKADIISTSDNNLLNITLDIAAHIENVGQDNYDNDYLRNLTLETNIPYFNVSEICYINKIGKIEKSSEPSWIGLDMTADPQSYEFYEHLILLGEETYVQAYGPIAKDKNIKMKFAGKRMSYGGFIQVCYDTDAFYGDLQNIVSMAVVNRRIGENGIMLIADKDQKLVGQTGGVDVHYPTISSLGFTTSLTELEELKIYSGKAFVNGKIQNVKYEIANKEGYYIVGIMLQSEIDLAINMSSYVSIYLQFIIFSIVFVVIYIILNRYVLNQLYEVNAKLDEITNGNLDVDVEVKRTEEFAYLSNSINATIGTMKQLIDKEAKRIDEELALAKTIQLSALPTQSIFINFHQFGIYATMKTAKEVGGDFYDYFPIGNDKFAILIADVSGKGIPAALFMMRTKTLIKSLLENGLSVEEALNRSNINLCEGNDAKMFVTCWLGLVHVDTGLVEYVNAGHNPPLIKQNGTFKYLKEKVNFILGALPKSKYVRQTFTLNPGDVIFLYTDGITEATIGNNQFYGEERLINYANTLKTIDPYKITTSILNNTIEYTAGHEQSDDMTLLTFAYYGTNKHTRFEYDGKVEQFEKAKDDMVNFYKENNVSKPIIDKFIICLEEIFVNIASYGYKNKEGKIIIYMDVSEKRAELTFIDSAPAFNPLNKEDPDVTLEASQRDIGGLGIFMVKKMMDHVNYAYLEKHNCLTMSIYLDDHK